MVVTSVPNLEVRARAAFQAPTAAVWSRGRASRLSNRTTAGVTSRVPTGRTKTQYFKRKKCRMLRSELSARSGISRRARGRADPWTGKPGIDFGPGSNPPRPGPKLFPRDRELSEFGDEIIERLAEQGLDHTASMTPTKRRWWETVRERWPSMVTHPEPWFREGRGPRGGTHKLSVCFIRWVESGSRFSRVLALAGPVLQLPLCGRRAARTLHCVMWRRLGHAGNAAV